MVRPGPFGYGNRLAPGRGEPAASSRPAGEFSPAPLADAGRAPYIGCMDLRRLAPCLLLLAGLAWALTDGAAGVRAADVGGRVVVDPAAAPWRAVGRLNVAGFRMRRHCTATLVAPDVALTARHCVGGFRGEPWVAPDLVHFLPGFSRGRYADHLQAVGYEPIGVEAVLVRLDGRASVPPVPVAEPGTAPGAALFEAGYSRDIGQVLTVDPACRFLGWSSDGMWTHNCEAIGGDSGAPMLVDTGDGLAIAAIHVGRRGGVGLAEPLDSGRLRRLAGR